MNVRHFSIAFFAGLIVGAPAGYVLPRVSPSETDHEEASKDRVTKFQRALTGEKNLGIPADLVKDTDVLSKQLETQLKIEELIIKSRAAEYAKITPFTSIAASVITAILGFGAGLLPRLLEKKRSSTS